MKIKKLDKYTRLYDLYENLLTDTQKKYFQEYFFNDNTLDEIALHFKVSKAAVFDSINKTIKTLDVYEEALRLSTKQKDIHDLVVEVLEEYDVPKNVIHKVKDILDERR